MLEYGEFIEDFFSQLHILTRGKPIFKDFSLSIVKNQ